VNVVRQSGRQKIVDMKKRIDYLKRRFGGWWKRKRDRNRRKRKRTRNGRKKRGRGGLRQPKKSMLGRKSWRKQDRRKGR
jgi:hypothetical protein